MSYNRRRNIYTLGDYNSAFPPHQQTLLKGRQYLDIFERDPFKIQSYNFHYAERPSSTRNQVDNLNNRARTLQSSAERFETFFYKYDIAANRPGKENTESKTRKLVQNTNQSGNQANLLNNTNTQRNDASSSSSSIHQIAISSQLQSHNNKQLNKTINSSSYTNTTATSTISRLLRTRYNSDYLQELQTICTSNTPSAIQPNQQQTSSPTQASTADVGPKQGGRRFNNQNSSASAIADSSQCVISCPRSNASHRVQRLQPMSPKPIERFGGGGSNARGNVNKCGGSRSGCRINIKIKGLDEHVLSENVTIEIEADANNAIAKKTSSIRANLNCDDSYSNKFNKCLESKSNMLRSISSSRKTDDLNIVPIKSSETFVMDKHRSKHSLCERQRASDLKDLKLKRKQQTSNTKHPDLQKKPTVLHSSHTTPVKACPERSPSRVPWGANVKPALAKKTSTQANIITNNVKTKATEIINSTTNMSRLIANYTSVIKDLRTLTNRNQQRTPEKPADEHKLLNNVATMPHHRSDENKPLVSSLRRSLRSTIENSNSPYKPKKVRSSRSAVSTSKRAKSPTPAITKSNQNLRELRSAALKFFRV